MKKESMKHETTFYLLSEWNFDQNRLKSAYLSAKLKKQSMNRLITGQHTI